MASPINTWAEVKIPHEFRQGTAPTASQFNENFQALALALRNLETKADAKAASPNALDALPKGIILAWYTKSGRIPNGWAICDGSNGTPDLRGRFLRGVATFADVGVDTNAKETHSHSVSGSASGTTEPARDNPDPWRVHERAAPSATGLDHTHKFSGEVKATTSQVPHIPPNATVLYIMKVQ